MNAPTIVLIGHPDWENRLAAVAQGRGFRVIHYADRAKYVSRLAADQPALVVVDGAVPESGYWITTARVSPATRRVPVVAVAPAPASQQAARDAGASFTLSPDQLERDLPPILDGHARTLSAADRAAQSEECDQPLPPQAAKAIRLFNAGEYYRQHDLLEALWMRTPGPARSLYQAILQAGIAYYQVTRGNRRGALKMLLRARQWLAILPDACQGVDVVQLREDAERVQVALEALGDGDLTSFDMALLKPVRMADGGKP